MNKLAQYLNQHLVGEVITDSTVLARLSTDNGPIKITPEMAVFPRNTNDIRKLMRFTWQLAEKGHKLPVTARGFGTSFTAGAVGSGVVVSLNSHMNTIFEYDGKQRLVRLQPGVSVDTLQNALNLQGVTIPAFEYSDGDATVGGMLANSSLPHQGEAVEQLEVVLSNGDVLQTKRLTKRELNKIKGKQGFEADVYRAVDGLIEENKELIDKMLASEQVGYNSLSRVKQKDGSFDLTPLFLGSQGTLGVISEMILKADYLGSDKQIVIGAFSDATKARDAVDEVAQVAPSFFGYYSEQVIKSAIKSGKTFSFLDEEQTPATVLIAILSDVSARAQAKKAKKLAKIFGKYEGRVSASEDLYGGELANSLSINALADQSGTAGAAMSIIDKAYVPLERFDEYQTGLAEIAKKLHTELALYGEPLEGLWSVRPVINLKTVGGKQTVFKLIDEYSQLVTQCGGYLAGGYGEGRLQSYSAHKQLDDEVKDLFQKLKAIFDPQDVLNPGVKQELGIKKLAESLRSDFASQNIDALPRV
ncbi:MAG TPA: FAD-binding oxidoreductase [Candidatus Saccharimonadales bacterium]